MKNHRIWKHLLISSVAALILYVAGFTWIEHRRTRLGPWEITFIQQSNAAPRLLINQPRLNVQNVELEFNGKDVFTVTNTMIQFLPGRPVPFSLPFGECVFMDPTFLPGTVTLQMVGHQIEVIPRTLIIDGEEYAWQPDLRVVLDGGASTAETD